MAELGRARHRAVVRWRWSAVASLIIGIILMAPFAAQVRATTASAGQRQSAQSLVVQRVTQDIDEASTRLAEMYRPFIGIQTQPTPCGPGEAYLPTDALASVAQPTVVLRNSSGAVIATSPTAADLAAAPNDSYIDYPGNALAPGCDYERWFRATGPPPPAVYGRVLTDPDHPGFVVVQYWMYWIFNDWNNNHEADWEMMQIIFEADSADEALTVQPTTVVVAQHEGAQYAPWTAVEQRDGRPVVYPAQGSHATFLSQARWLGKSAEAGFGCDDTRGPSTILDPSVIMLPGRIDPQGQFAWVLWEGRWGERQAIFNNGSTGPIVKTQWESPITWTNDIARTTSLRAPDFGNSATNFFCTATERGSVVMLKLFDDPLLMSAILGIVIVAFVVLSRRTRWSPRLLRPIAAPRRVGQIISSAVGVLIAERRRFLPVAALVLAGGILASILRLLLLKIPSIRDADLLLAGDALSRAVFALVAGLAVTIPVAIVAVALAAAVASDLDQDDERVSLSHLMRHRGLGSVIVIVAVGFILLGPLTLVIGAYLVARWAAAPALALHGSGFRPSLRASARLTSGGRWRIFGLLVVAIPAAAVLGPLVGTLVLIATGAPFGLVSIIASAITAVTIPWLAITLVMLHGDLETRRDQTAV